MKLLHLLTLTLALVFPPMLTNPNASAAEKIVVGYQPYDTISYSAAVIRDKELWKKYLPAGTEVQFEGALQGSIIVNSMVAGKQVIGYLGDMPAVVCTTKTNIAPIKLVASLGLSAGQRCNVIMVRPDAPKFTSPEEAVRWLDGKTVATPKGSCAERFLRTVMQKTGIKPKQILNQSLEVIATNFRVKKIDAAVLWEPTVSRIGDLAGEGVARVVATGYNYNTPDAGFIAMRADFVKQHPEIAKGWLKAELEAQRFLMDPANWEEVGNIVAKQATGLTPLMSWFSLYGAIPTECGGAPERDTKPFVFTKPVYELLDSTYTFLHETKVINVGKAPEGAIDDSIARVVAAEMNVTTPMGVIIPKNIYDGPKK